MCNSFRALGAELFLLLSAALASLRFLLRLSTFLLCFVYLLSYNEMIFLAQNIYMKKKPHSRIGTSVVFKQLTFSRGNVLSYGFDVSRPLGRVSSNKLCHAVKRFAISVPRDSKP